MAKELPYYRFNPDEYLTGDITFESYECQGVFKLACCFYWKSDCDITLQKLFKRIPNAEHLLKKLIESKIIKHFEESDKIKINFLHKQYQPLISISESRKNAAEVRWSKERDNKQVKSKSNASAEHLNIYKDNNNNKDNIIPFSDFWNKYNKKTGSKPNAEKAWNKLSKIERELAINTIEKYQKTVSDRKFIKDAQGYLNQKYWESYIESEKSEPKELTEEEKRIKARELVKKQIEYTTGIKQD